MANTENQAANLKPIALANTFAIIDLVLHPLFHIWVSIHPESYERIMHLFVAGLNVKVNSSDSGLWHIVVGTILEVSVFWFFGFAVAIIYNKLALRK